jgi:hypothetical protein
MILLYRKVKPGKDCKSVMWKHKGGREEANSWPTIYSMVSVGTKQPLVHVVEALHTRIFLPGHQVSPKRTTWLATKARHEGTCQALLATLMPPPLRSFFTKGRGFPRPPHKVSSPLHTKSEGRRRLPVSHLGPKAFGAPCTSWSTQESPHKVGTTQR